MKKIVLSFVCVFITCMVSHAQGVKFESGTWEEILTKAKTENKTIFVDVYTKWCGPCKHVSKTVFPQEKLGDFYNYILVQSNKDSPFHQFQNRRRKPCRQRVREDLSRDGLPDILFHRRKRESDP